jgi:2'-5' RNA ligase
VTILDEPADLERLSAVAGSMPPLRLRISRSARWIAPDPGLFLVVDDPHSDLRRFREAVVGPERVTYRAHVTLLHRDSISSPEQVEEAWASLGDRDLGQDFIVDEIVVHDQIEGDWREVARLRFAGEQP